MADQFFALSGYDSTAGSGAHAAARRNRIPMPSLLRALLSEHLDPGYAAAAERRAEAPRTARNTVAVWGWRLLGVLAAGVVFAGAAGQAQLVAPREHAAQQGLAGNVRSAEATTGKLVHRRDELADQVDTLQRRRLNDDVQGKRLLEGFDALSLAAASTAVTGPGLAVRVSDPGVERNLSDASKQRFPASRQIILDRDLQLVVNSLWSAGAEAISVGGVRIGPNVTIRQAGGAILVDNTPISSPYAILAIGAPTMQDSFNASRGLYRLRQLEVGYRVGVTVNAVGDLSIPAGTIRDVKYAKEIPQK